VPRRLPLVRFIERMAVRRPADGLKVREYVRSLASVRGIRFIGADRILDPPGESLVRLVTAATHNHVVPRKAFSNRLGLANLIPDHDSSQGASRRLADARRLHRAFLGHRPPSSHACSRAAMTVRCPRATAEASCPASESKRTSFPSRLPAP